MKRFISDMSSFLFFVIITIIGVTIGIYCESKKDPYEEGMHWNYSIHCENGYVYKIIKSGRGSILVLNSDGTPLKCGQKIY